MKKIFVSIAIIAGFGIHSQVRSQTVSWKFSAKAAFVASPVEVDQVIYLGSTDSFFYAIDARNGKQRWALKTGGDIRSTACLYHQQLYFVSGDGYLWCVSTNGTVQWKFKTGGEKKYELFSFSDYYQSSPVCSNGVIYFGSGDHHVYAVDAASGALRWKFATDNIVHTSPAIHQDKVYVGSFDGWFYALHQQTGQLLWKFKSVGQRYFPKGEFNGSPTVAGDAVFAGARDFNFYAIDTARPSCLWNRSFLKGWAITTPLYKEGALYVGTSEDRVFLCLDPADGHTKWSFEAGFNIFGSPEWHDSTIYFGTMMGKLFGLNARTGKQVFYFTTDGCQTHYGRYFQDNGQYRADIGRLIRKNEDLLILYQDMGAILSKPLVIGGQMWVSSMDGQLYCIQLPTL